jgi:hypothetical protein
MPTPTCTQFQTTKIPCLKCGELMGLTLIEPGGRPNFELRTYSCVRCEIGESFLMGIKPAESADPSVRPTAPSSPLS